MMYGDRSSKPEKVDAVADAIARKLGYEDSTDIRHGIHEWVGRALTEDKPFIPHPDADLLDRQERDAVNELIRLLALSKKQGGEADGDAAPTNPPGSGPNSPVTPIRPTGGKPPMYSFDDDEDAAARDEDAEPPKIGDDG